MIGRHRIDEVIKFRFREAVSQAEQSFISRYVDIVLESGAGPTVQESLKNPALFSMIIQLSLLTFSHETENLANAIVEAIERIVKSSGKDIDIVPDYVSLLGTLKACQQQTATFRWAPLYESVERKIESSLQQAKEHVPRTPNTNKRRKLSMTLATKPECILDRHLPFPILQSLLMWLQSLQSFPEHRVLHLKSDSGINTILVWCHHVLGLGVVVRIQEVEIHFGDEPRSLVIEDRTTAQGVNATLLDAADQHEPLFTLASHQNDPILSHEHRVEAFGFGLKVLAQANAQDEEKRRCAHWLITRGLASIRHLEQLEKGNAHQALFNHRQPESDHIIEAGKFLFALESIDDTLLGEQLNPTSERILKSPLVNWSALIALLHIFARIETNDLEQCRNFPISMHVFQRLETAHHGIAKFRAEVPEAPINLLTSFNILCRLLLGSSFTEEYTKPAVLISAWGWSIFFNSVDALDPADVSVRKMRLLQGVPARRNLRRARIIDGPTTVFLSSSVGQTINKMPHVLYYPGISTSSRDHVLVGHQSDAFSVTQSFEWDCTSLEDQLALPTAHSSGKRKLGFRMMLEMCANVGMYPLCECEEEMQEPHKWIDCYTSSLEEKAKDVSADKKSDSEADLLATNWFLFTDKDRWPRTESLRDQLTERVVTCKVAPSFRNTEMDYSGLVIFWYFYVSKNPAARWLQLNDMYQSSEDDFNIMMRGKATCLKCVMKNAYFDKRNASLVLL